MNKEEVIKLAREAGLLPLLDEDCFQAMGSKNFDVTKKVLERFAALVAAAERNPLTEEELEQAYRHIWRNIPENFDHTSMGWIEQGIRYAEQAHRIGEKK